MAQALSLPRRDSSRRSALLTTQGEHMSSQRRIDASRANGAKSRGPVTPEGRARSNMAAVTHGLRSRTVLLKNESEEDFNALHDLLVDHFQPANPYETDLVERLVAARWRLDRVSSMETALLEVEVARREPEIEKEFKSCCPEVRNALAFRALFDESRVLAGLSRYESRFRRTCEKLTKELNSLRALRKLNEGPNPKNDQAHFNLGNRLSHKDNWEAAVPEYREAVRLDPKNAPWHTTLGLALTHLKDWNGAVAEYGEAVRLNSNNHLAHYLLGTAYEHKGDRQAAWEQYRTAYQMDPKDDTYKQAYDRLAAQVNR